LRRVFSTTCELIFRILSKDQKTSSFFSISSALFAENNQGVPLFCVQEHQANALSTSSVFQNGNCFDPSAPLTLVFAALTRIIRVGGSCFFTGHGPWDMGHST